MQQSVICILDILGTKGVWTELSVEKYFISIKEAEKLITPAKKYFSDALKGVPLELDFISFSDTLLIILMKTEKDEEKDAYFFHEVIGGFSQLVLGIFQCYFAEYFFLRGAISFGEIEKYGNHFVGPAVDDAAEYFELPDMIGICFTPKASIAMDYAIDWNLKFNHKKIDSYTVKYKTPLKTNNNIELYQIDWIKHFTEQANISSGISPVNMLSSFLSKRNIPNVAVSKFINTINFFNEVSKKI